MLEGVAQLNVVVEQDVEAKAKPSHLFGRSNCEL
jgi:hypothetical protein